MLPIFCTNQLCVKVSSYFNIILAKELKIISTHFLANYYHFFYKGGRCKKGFLHYAAGGTGADCLGVTRNLGAKPKSSAEAACTNLDGASIADGSEFCDSSDGGFQKQIQVA